MKNKTMNTYIKEFCETYLKKVKNDKDIKENPMDQEVSEILSDYRERITFFVGYSEHTPNTLTLPIGYWGNKTIILDDQDLSYLYNKYIKLLEKEQNENILKIKEGYYELMNLKS